MTSEELKRLDREVIWHPYSPLVGSSDPILISSAEGAYFHTADGRKILDAISSWWVNTHGHARKEIADAIAKQASEMQQVMFAGFTHEPAIKLGKGLLEILPKNQSKVFFSDDGSTAVEVGLKMAFQYWHNMQKPKTKVIALDGAYHGDTFGAMAVGERGTFTEPFFPYLFKVDFVDFPQPDNEDKVIQQFREIASSGEVAAFIFEPLVQGAAGMRMYSPELLERLFGICQEYEILTIADEVMTGFGRTGKYFATDYLSVDPDIYCLSKGLTGGTIALGVTTCSKDVEKAYHHADITKTFFHGHSFTANPIACAAANASLELLRSQDCQKQLEMITKHHLEFYNKVEDHPMVAKIQHLGTILSIEVKSDDATSYTNNLRKKISTYFMERDLHLRPLGNVIYIIPPFVVNAEDLAKIYNAIMSFLNEINQ